MNAQLLPGNGKQPLLACMEPCAHVLHIYEDDGVFLDTLEGFVSGGFRGGETVVVIATSQHLYALDHRLQTAGRDVHALRSQGDYITMDAREALDRFMVDGVPDEALFAATITRVIHTAQIGGRRVRAFGEMVALLWAEGRRGATVQLEQMWNTLCRENGLSLFCAYPRDADDANALVGIRALHSHVIATDQESAA
jgi:MEDS: MEthanogen/methylotroph, DcmR Sensory domain